MASRVSKRKSAQIKGVLEVKDGEILINVEDVTEPYVLSDFIRDFDGLDVRISITHSQDEI